MAFGHRLAGVNFFMLEMTILFVFPCSSSLCTLFFFCRCIFHGENRETKSPVLMFFKKSEKRRFCFAIFSIKNASTEKKQNTP